MERKLRLIKTEEPPKVEEREYPTFWTTCPLKLKFLPEKTCKVGQISSTSDPKNKCEWSVNSKTHNFCFWKYTRDAKNRKTELSRHDRAKLLNITTSKLDQLEQEAMQEFVTICNKNNIDLTELLSS